MPYGQLQVSKAAWVRSTGQSSLCRHREANTHSCQGFYFIVIWVGSFGPSRWRSHSSRSWVIIVFPVCSPPSKALDCWENRMRTVCIGCSFSLSHQTVIQTSIKLQTPSLTSPLWIFHVGSSASGTGLPFISPRRCWEGLLILEILKQSHPPDFQQSHDFATQGLGIDVFFSVKIFFRKLAKPRLTRLLSANYTTLPLPETVLMLRDMQNKSRQVSGNKVKLQSSKITPKVINVLSEITSKCTVKIASVCRDLEFAISRIPGDPHPPCSFLTLASTFPKYFFF